MLVQNMVVNVGTEGNINTSNKHIISSTQIPLNKIPYRLKKRVLKNKVLKKKDLPKKYGFRKRRQLFLR